MGQGQQEGKTRSYKEERSCIWFNNYNNGNKDSDEQAKLLMTN